MVIEVLFTIPKEEKGFPDSSVGKESTCNAGDPRLIPGLGRSPDDMTERLSFSFTFKDENDSNAHQWMNG